MKKIAFLLILLGAGLFVSAQTMDTVVLLSKAKKFTPKEHILLMFELVDTMDVSGKKATISRSYYFNENSRRISSVREFENPRKPEKGMQVIYSFGGNKLTSVTVIPPRSKCRNCAIQYNYSNDSLVSKPPNNYGNINPAGFIKQAHYFQSKLPNDLPWGFFSGEVMVNGEKKKLKKEY